MLNNRIFISLIGVGLFIATSVMVILSFWTFNQIVESADLRKHTFTVIINAENLISKLKDAEAGQSGYALTADKTYLDSYFPVRDSIDNDLGKLRRLTLIDEAKVHLDAMAILMEARMNELSHVIKVRETGTLDDVIAAVVNGRGKILIEMIGAEKDNFIQIQQSAFIRHEAGLQINLRRMSFIMVATSLITLLLSLAFAYFMHKERQQRLKNLVYRETQDLLDRQEVLNKRLQYTNESLQASEEKLAVTLSSIGDAVMATDAEGFVTLLNPLAEKLRSCQVFCVNYLAYLTDKAEFAPRRKPAVQP